MRSEARTILNAGYRAIKKAIVESIHFDPETLLVRVDEELADKLTNAFLSLYERLKANFQKRLKRFRKFLFADITAILGDLRVAEAYRNFALQLKRAVDARANERVKELIMKKLQEGLPRKELAEMIAQEFKDWTEKYAKTIAISESTRAYNMGELALAIEAGAEYFLFDAVLDMRTTPQCRSRDGQVFHISQLAGNVPPLHANCRSVLRAMTSEMVKRFGYEEKIVKDTSGFVPAKDWGNYQRFVVDYIKKLRAEVGNAQPAVLEKPVQEKKVWEEEGKAILEDIFKSFEQYKPDPDLMQDFRNYMLNTEDGQEALKMLWVAKKLNVKIVTELSMTAGYYNENANVLSLNPSILLFARPEDRKGALAIFARVIKHETRHAVFAAVSCTKLQYAFTKAILEMLDEINRQMYSKFATDEFKKLAVFKWLTEKRDIDSPFDDSTFSKLRDELRKALRKDFTRLGGREGIKHGEMMFQIVFNHGLDSILQGIMNLVRSVTPNPNAFFTGNLAGWIHEYLLFASRSFVVFEKCSADDPLWVFQAVLYGAPWSHGTIYYSEFPNAYQTWLDEAYASIGGLQTFLHPTDLLQRLGLYEDVHNRVMSWALKNMNEKQALIVKNLVLGTTDELCEAILNLDEYKF